MINESTRIKIQQKLNEIREIRNDFAHNFAHNKDIDQKNVKERIIELYDFEEGITTTKFFKMQEIMDIIGDSWIMENLNNLLKLTREIRER